jgi:predicted DNA-binding transcriptional regulator AlpA
MTSPSIEHGSAAQKVPASALGKLLTPKEAAALWRVSDSFLAKARMRGDGPPYTKVGRSVRYSEADLLSWMKTRKRHSTSEE